MRKRGVSFFIFSLMSVLLLMACAQRLTYPTQPQSSEPKTTAGTTIVPLSKGKFLYAVDWLDEGTLLVALKSDGVYGLYSHNLQTGEEQPIRIFSERLVFAALSPDGRRIIVQTASPQGNKVMVIDRLGNPLSEGMLPDSEVKAVSWNRTNEGLLFLSVQKTSGDKVSYLWDLVNAEWKEMVGAETLPCWYSENMYLHQQTGTDGIDSLLLSDIRFPGKDTVVEEEILAFSIKGETVLVVTPSDFDENELFIISYYPLLISEGFIVVSRTEEGNGSSIPEFARAKDSNETFAVIPGYADNLAAGVVYELVRVDFSGNASEVLAEVDRLAPIAASPDGAYVLYGERYEQLYDSEQDAWVRLAE
ncbi:YqgU-like beta propeller domain-containing protein [Trichococcus ilyis]|uniref:YqgU-like 6-bladed beta-propeller domain-containing protein n=1 Tax=Trichococcus ilyis TaxID=640938 RepID=A0A143Y8Z8_9LACT|nr:hypothetical protein [Trichococcus ilyis]CZQ82828.1 Hypothetical protein TR210_251 [Trichococcus ilyis]SEI49015.1 hypothetical protein SAMN05216375_10116 [Trichococcus ilyis]